MEFTEWFKVQRGLKSFTMHQFEAHCFGISSDTILTFVIENLTSTCSYQGVFAKMGNVVFTFSFSVVLPCDCCVTAVQ